MDKDFSKFEEYSEVDELSELDGLNDSDILDMEIVEIVDEEGNAYQYYHLGDVEYEDKTYAFFSLVEEVEEIEEDEAVVYEVDNENKELIEITNKELIDRLFLEFVSTFKGEYIKEELN